jgi:hypothetical protein
MPSPLTARCIVAKARVPVPWAVYFGNETQAQMLALQVEPLGQPPQSGLHTHEHEERSAAKARSQARALASQAQLHVALEKVYPGMQVELSLHLQAQAA